MPRFAANLTMLFTELPFLNRFEAARKAGFRYVEYLSPYEYEPGELTARLRNNNLTQVLLNLPSGNWSAGERGIAGQPDRVQEFRDGVRLAIDWAEKLGVARLNCLVGRRNEAFSLAEQRRTAVENIRYAAQELARHGLRLTVEPLNHLDTPGFLLPTAREALDVLNEVNHPNAFLQLDFYHAQREGEDIAAILDGALPRIGHIQIADSPGRHQPGTGEMDYARLLRLVDASGYDGFVSLEYVPTPDTLSSLGWVTNLGFRL